MVPEITSRHTRPQRIEPADRHYVQPSPDVSEHIYREQLRRHDCGNTTPVMLVCPVDECSRMLLCEHCQRVINLLLPAQGGWCDMVETERQHQLS